MPRADKSQRSRRLLQSTGEDSAASSASIDDSTDSSASTAPVPTDEESNANDVSASAGDSAQTQEEGTDSAARDTNE